MKNNTYKPSRGDVEPSSFAEEGYDQPRTTGLNL
jgi:hypothetical protein